MNILLLASHAVAEYDDVRMFTDLGYDIFAPGGYEVPGAVGEGIRPPLPDAPHHPDLVARLNEVRAEHGEPGPLIDAGKARLHDDIIDWADTIIVHHFPERWIGGQWERIRHKRVIWRTCGQSDKALEEFMGQFRPEGLEIVRYSPREEVHFTRKGAFAGQDAIIRFGKYPNDYGPWIGDWPVVGNVTQNMKQRGNACGYDFWQAATEGLPTRPAGAGSEEMGGLGCLPYEAMLAYLTNIRAYLYTGTTPASYTLGLIEAMLSGVPVVSIGPEAWGDGWDGADLFEGHEITGKTLNDPVVASDHLRALLNDPGLAKKWGLLGKLAALQHFDVRLIGAQWQAFLG